MIEIEEAARFQFAFEQLKVEFLQVKAENREMALKEAPDFNVFRLLGVGRDELRHSLMLAHLLDPSVSHGQGDLFLCAFLELYMKKHPEFLHLMKAGRLEHWSITTELPITHKGDSRLDIVVKNPALGFLCVIENKVDAFEQPDQLQRYWKWMSSQKCNYPTQVLFFLTVFGYESETAGDAPYDCLSYRQDITAWLEHVLPEIQAPAVRELVRQYAILVSQL
jgi:hypothetical protein